MKKRSRILPIILATSSLVVPQQNVVHATSTKQVEQALHMAIDLQRQMTYTGREWQMVSSRSLQQVQQLITLLGKAAPKSVVATYRQAVAHDQALQQLYKTKRLYDRELISLKNGTWQRSAIARSVEQSARALRHVADAKWRKALQAKHVAPWQSFAASLPAVESFVKLAATSSTEERAQRVALVYPQLPEMVQRFVANTYERLTTEPIVITASRATAATYAQPVIILAEEGERVEIANLRVNGTITIDKKHVKSGDVSLTNVAATTIVVNDVATNSLHLRDVTARNVLVQDDNGARIVTDGVNAIDELQVTTPTELVANGAQSFQTVTVSGTAPTVTVRGNFAATAFRVTAPLAAITLAKETVVASLTASGDVKVSGAPSALIREVALAEATTKLVLAAPATKVVVRQEAAALIVTKDATIGELQLDNGGRVKAEAGATVQKVNVVRNEAQLEGDFSGARIEAGKDAKVTELSKPVVPVNAAPELKEKANWALTIGTKHALQVGEFVADRDGDRLTVEAVTVADQLVTVSRDAQQNWHVTAQGTERRTTTMTLVVSDGQTKRTFVVPVTIQPVIAQVKAVTAALDGTVVVELDREPTVAPTKDDFQLAVGKQRVVVEAAAYDQKTRRVTLTVAAWPATYDEQTIQYAVTYRQATKLAPSFVVKALIPYVTAIVPFTVKQGDALPSTVTVQLSDGKTAARPVTWSIVAPTKLGAYEETVTIDGQPFTASFVVQDETAPILTLKRSEYDVAFGADVTFLYEIDDVNVARFVSEPQQWNVWQAGTYTVEVYAVDEANNRSARQTVTVRVAPLDDRAWQALTTPLRAGDYEADDWARLAALLQHDRPLSQAQLDDRVQQLTAVLQTVQTKEARVLAKVYAQQHLTVTEWQSLHFAMFAAQHVAAYNEAIQQTKLTDRAQLQALMERVNEDEAKKAALAPFVAEVKQQLAVPFHHEAEAEWRTLMSRYEQLPGADRRFVVSADMAQLEQRLQLVPLAKQLLSFNRLITEADEAELKRVMATVQGHEQLLADYVTYATDAERIIVYDRALTAAFAGVEAAQLAEWERTMVSAVQQAESRAVLREKLTAVTAKWQADQAQVTAFSEAVAALPFAFHREQVRAVDELFQQLTPVQRRYVATTVAEQWAKQREAWQLADVLAALDRPMTLADEAAVSDARKQYELASDECRNRVEAAYVIWQAANDALIALRWQPLWSEWQRERTDRLLAQLEALSSEATIRETYAQQLAPGKAELIAARATLTAEMEAKRALIAAHARDEYVASQLATLDRALTEATAALQAGAETAMKRAFTSLQPLHVETKRDAAFRTLQTKENVTASTWRDLNMADVVAANAAAYTAELGRRERVATFDDVAALVTTVNTEVEFEAFWRPFENAVLEVDGVATKSEAELGNVFIASVPPLAGAAMFVYRAGAFYRIELRKNGIVRYYDCRPTFVEQNTAAELERVTKALAAYETYAGDIEQLQDGTNLYEAAQRAVEALARNNDYAARLALLKEAADRKREVGHFFFNVKSNLNGVGPAYIAEQVAWMATIKTWSIYRLPDLFEIRRKQLLRIAEQLPLFDAAFIAEGQRLFAKNSKGLFDRRNDGEAWLAFKMEYDRLKTGDMSLALSVYFDYWAMEQLADNYARVAQKGGQLEADAAKWKTMKLSGFRDAFDIEPLKTLLSELKFLETWHNVSDGDIAQLKAIIAAYDFIQNVSRALWSYEEIDGRAALWQQLATDYSNQLTAEMKEAIATVLAKGQEAKDVKRRYESMKDISEFSFKTLAEYEQYKTDIFALVKQQQHLLATRLPGNYVLSLYFPSDLIQEMYRLSEQAERVTNNLDREIAHARANFASYDPFDHASMDRARDYVAMHHPTLTNLFADEFARVQALFVVNQAYELVEKAKATRTSSDIANANAAVQALPESSYKAKLQEQLQLMAGVTTLGTHFVIAADGQVRWHS